MPYLSWLEGSQLMRHTVQGGCRIGRDPVVCDLAPANHGSLARMQAAIDRVEGIWWIRDLDPANGSRLNGMSIGQPQGSALRDGDELDLGGWRLTFTEGFPGLDGTTFAERVGDLFHEVRPEPAQAPMLIRGIELLFKSTERLLWQTDADAMVKEILEEALRLLGGDRGFLVLKQGDSGWRTAHRVGDVQEGIGLSRAVLDYVSQERTAVLSNRPLADPRFGGMSLVELHRGSLLCAPIEHDHAVHGALYLDRQSENRPFSRFDLAIFQAFVKQGSLALQQATLNRRVLNQAEQEGELLRLRAAHQRDAERHGQVFAAMAAPIRRVQSWSEELAGTAGDAIRTQLEQLTALLEHGARGDQAGLAPSSGHPMALTALQEELVRRWNSLLHFRHASLKAPEAPDASIWVTEASLTVALSGLVEPVLMQLGRDATVALRWDQERAFRVLRLSLPAGLQGPVLDPWTEQVLQAAGVRWRWADPSLEVLLPEGPDVMPEEPSRPLLGLVSEDLNLVGLFQTVAQAGDLALYPLEMEPPPPPLPKFRFLVVDAQAADGIERCIQAYRRHPSFGTTPILVVRCAEDDTPRLSAAGATDWLAEGFRWETLHQRLQVLRGHTELHQRALAAERLESFRQMAGTLKHEINNPLAIISMQVEMLQRKYPDEVKLGKIAEMVDRIRALMQVLQKMREAPTEDYADGSSILKLS